MSLGPVINLFEGHALTYGIVDKTLPVYSDSMWFSFARLLRIVIVNLILHFPRTDCAYLVRRSPSYHLMREQRLGCGQSDVV